MSGDRVRIYLFGEPRLEARGEAYAFKAPPKTLPLLAYLLLQRRAPVSREKVAAALWPDADQSTAYSNLRRHLHYLTKALPEPEREPWLVVTQKSVGWNLQSAYWLDVEAFETEIHERSTRARAVRLYCGDLYERCAEEWIDFERERLRTMQLSALAHLCTQARERGTYVQALHYAQLMLSADPWREDALRAIMETRMLLGDRAGAVAEYDRFAMRLKQELQTVPLAETTQAYERIRRSMSAPSAAPAQTHVTVTPVGRENELAALRDEWQRAARGNGRAIFVGGEAGIGKTTLLEALSESVLESGGSVLAGATAANEETPYAPFLSVAQAVGVDLFGAAASGDDRLRKFEEFADALERRSRASPLLVALEDVHWAGSSTLELLRYLIVRLSDAPVLFVATYREFQLGGTHPLRALRRELTKSRRSTSIALSALGRDDVQALSCSRAGRSLSDDLVESIYDRSGGNPLFVVELVRALREGGPERVPSSIAEIVNERVSRLGAEAHALLQTAAAAGASTSIEMLARITGMREGDVHERLDELIATHFVRQSADGDCSFVHEVIREAVYEGIGADAARAMHARAGFALRSLYGERFGEVAAAAAWHFERGGITDAATAAYLTAAEHALRVYAIEEAARYAEKVRQAAQNDGDAFRALQVLEFTAGCRAEREEQRKYVTEMLHAAQRLGNAEQAEALMRDCDFHSADPPDEQEQSVLRLQRFVENAPEYEGGYLLRYGEFLSRTGEMHEAKDALQRALDALKGGSDVEALLRCLTALYVAALFSGNALAPIEAQVREARAHLAQGEDARVGARLSFVQCGALLDRDPPAAQKVAEEMLQCAENAGDVWLKALAHRSIGACATRRMRIGEAQRHLRECAEIAAAAGRVRDLTRTHIWQLLVENRCANFPAARAFGAQAAELARACGAVDMLASIQGNLANTAVWSGDLNSAESLLHEAVRLCDEHGYPKDSMESLLGEVYVGQGKLEEGAAVIERAWGGTSPQYDALGVDRVHRPLLLGLAYLAMGRDREARECASTVRSQLAAFECYYVHPQAYLWSAAQFLRLLDYEEDAQTFAHASRRRYEEVLASIEDAQSRETFAAFVFNRHIAGEVHVRDPLQAWFLPYCALEESARSPSAGRAR